MTTKQLEKAFTIETKGFRKVVVEKNGKPQIMDNPGWKWRLGS